MERVKLSRKIVWKMQMDKVMNKYISLFPAFFQYFWQPYMQYDHGDKHEIPWDRIACYLL